MKFDNLIADSVAILAPFKKSDPFVREKATKYLKMAAAKNLPEVGIKLQRLRPKLGVGYILCSTFEYFLYPNSADFKKKIVFLMLDPTAFSHETFIQCFGYRLDLVLIMSVDPSKLLLRVIYSMLVSG